MGGTGQVLDIGQHIARRITAGVGGAVDRDIHARSRGRVIRRIGASAAVKAVRTQPAGQDVVAGTACDGVGIAIACQRVVQTRADQVFDIDQHIACRIAAGVGSAVDRDIDARSRGRIIHRVGASAAIKAVRARTADQAIVFRSAIKRVVEDVAGQHIIARKPGKHVACQCRAADAIGKAGSDDVLDRVGHGITCRIAANAHSTTCRDRDPRRRGAVIHRVGACAAVQAVGACAADQLIIAGPAIQAVVARKPGQRVVADPAGQDVVAAVAGQRVVQGRTGQVLHIGQNVALGIAASVDGAVDRDVHRSRRGGVVHRVIACATVDGVCARQTGQGVVARSTRQDVGAGISGQRVGKAGAGQVFHVGQEVARGIATGARSPADGDGNARRRGRIVHRINAGAAVDDVVASTTDQRVILAAAIQAVVARSAGKAVGQSAAIDCVVASIARQRVGKGRADQVFHVGQHITRRIAAGVDSAVDRDVHRSGGGRIIHRVVADPAVDAVSAGQTR